MINLTIEEEKNLQNIQKKYYMPPIIKRLDQLIINKGYKESFSYLYETLLDAHQEINAIIEERKKQGIIRDISQTKKSIVSAIFSNAIVYLFLQAKQKGLVKENIFITSKLGRFKEMTAIHIDGETQKPDMDLVLFGEDEQKQIKNMMILSLKTSLRERAGQTYKWKLLLEIATSENSIREKYNIHYPLGKTPLVCFATVNFYDEINQPQHRGMFKFFDKSFIGKPISSDFIDQLSSLIDFANENLA